MKGDKKLLTVLNQLLADELTAISQEMVHGEIDRIANNYVMYSGWFAPQPPEGGDGGDRSEE